MSYIIPGFIVSKQSEDLFSLFNQYTEAEAEFENDYFEEYFAIFNEGIENVESELETFLFENGFLFDENNLDSTLEDYYSDNDTNLEIIILPTEKCNFRCVYCYEEHDFICEAQVEYQKISDFIENRIKSEKKYKQVSLSWFGGEPLLRKEEIFSFTKKIRLLCEENGIEFSSSITTNGYLLDIPTFSCLVDLGVKSYQITLDGDKHDEQRPLKSGVPTKEKILKNLSEIHKTTFDYTVGIRVNVDENSGNNRSFYDELKKALGDDNRFMVYVHEIFDTGKETSEKVNLDKLKRVIENNNKELLSAGLRKTSGSSGIIDICYANSRECFTFRPNGRIVKCTVELEENWNLIGRVSEEECKIDSDKNRFLTRKLIKDKCKICAKISECKSIRCLRAMKAGVCHYEKRKITQV